jgi:hypothetical protein
VDDVEHVQLHRHPLQQPRRRGTHVNC